jgi:hypothetical protein
MPEGTRHPAARRRPDPRRIGLAALGLLSVGVGALGVVLPGLPTTIFLILASWCFARSCPWLERKLIRNRFFGPFLRYLEPGAVMPMRARVVSIALMWTAVLISAVVLIRGEITLWAPASIVAAGVIGTVAIWRVARPRPALATAAD